MVWTAIDPERDDVATIWRRPGDWELLYSVNGAAAVPVPRCLRNERMVSIAVRLLMDYRAQLESIDPAEELTLP